jgi:hypothetical protein
VSRFFLLQIRKCKFQCFISSPKKGRFICAVCDSSIAEHRFRYKCLQCPDYNLCLNCAAQGAHNGHIMLRLSTDRIRSFNENGETTLELMFKIRRSQRTVSVSDLIFITFPTRPKAIVERRDTPAVGRNSFLKIH